MISRSFSQARRWCNQARRPRNSQLGSERRWPRSKRSKSRTVQARFISSVTLISKMYGAKPAQRPSTACGMRPVASSSLTRPIPESTARRSRLSDDEHRCSDLDPAEQVENIGIAHSDAAIRNGRADQLRSVGAVNAVGPVAEYENGGPERIVAARRD